MTRYFLSLFLIVFSLDNFGIYAEGTNFLGSQQKLKRGLGAAINSGNTEAFIQALIVAKQAGIEDNILREAARRAFTEHLYATSDADSMQTLLSFFQGLGVNQEIVFDLKEKIHQQENADLSVAPDLDVEVQPETEAIEEIPVEEEDVITEDISEEASVLPDNYGGDIQGIELKPEDLSNNKISPIKKSSSPKFKRAIAVTVFVASLSYILYLLDDNWNNGKYRKEMISELEGLKMNLKFYTQKFSSYIKEIYNKQNIVSKLDPIEETTELLPLVERVVASDSVVHHNPSSGFTVSLDIGPPKKPS